MGRNRNPPDDPRPSPNPETPPQEIERRLSALEKSAIDLNNRVFDAQKIFVTIIFSAVAALLTVYGVMSRLDVRESTAKVEKATEDMKREFQNLAGNALRRPELQILFRGKSLNGQTLEDQAPLNPIFLKNVGNKSTEPLSIRLFYSQGVSLLGVVPTEIPSSDSDFPHCAFLGGGQLTVGAKETWVYDQPLGLGLSADSTNGLLKLVVYYGGEDAVNASFNIVRIKK